MMLIFRSLSAKLPDDEYRLLNPAVRITGSGWESFTITFNYNEKPATGRLLDKTLWADILKPMSEMSPDFPEDYLEHFEYDDDYQDQAQLLDESLFHHRKMPLYQAGDRKTEDSEVIMLVPEETARTRFDWVIVDFAPPGKDPYEPFVRIQMLKELTGKNYINETALMYFDNKYLAIRSVYTVSPSGDMQIKMNSKFEKEVTTDDLKELNRVINNSGALV
jgi:hypothetical protein